MQWSDIFKFNTISSTIYDKNKAQQIIPWLISTIIQGSK